MATKYTGQNALNKLIQLVKTALNNKADKSALDGKLDVTGGTIFGDLKVKTNAEGTGNIDVEGEIRASGMARAMTVYATNTVRSELMVDTPLLNLKPSSSEKSVQVQQDGDTAVKMECFDGTLSKGYARLEIGTPTDATTLPERTSYVRKSAPVITAGTCLQGDRSDRTDRHRGAETLGLHLTGG